MSYTVLIKFAGDVEVFQKAMADRADEFRAIADKGRSLGAITHRFAVGDGFIIAVDEWDNPASFQTFSSDPEFQAFVGSVGASGPPEVWVGESIESPDQF